MKTQKRVRAAARGIRTKLADIMISYPQSAEFGKAYIGEIELRSAEFAPNAGSSGLFDSKSPGLVPLG